MKKRSRWGITIIMMVCFTLQFGMSVSANSKHPLIRFFEINSYNSISIDTVEKANQIIKDYNLILINDPEYEHYDEIYECMREKGDDWYDFEPYDIREEGERFLIYASADMIKEFLWHIGKDDYKQWKGIFLEDLLLLNEHELSHEEAQTEGDIVVDVFTDEDQYSEENAEMDDVSQTVPEEKEQVMEVGKNENAMFDGTDVHGNNQSAKRDTNKSKTVIFVILGIVIVVIVVFCVVWRQIIKSKRK